MSKLSQYLPLTKVVSGMVLATDLLDKQGHVLLPAGISLTDATLRSLANHQITQLCVEKNGISDDERLQNKEHQAARIEQLFRHSNDDHANTSLKRYLQHYREEQAQ